MSEAPVVTGIRPGSPVRYRLARPASGASRLHLTDEQQAVVGNRHRRLRVLAGPGTGKTSTLVETVAARITDGVARPEQILVLTFSRRARDELAQRITARIGTTTRTPLVRTLHSYAFSLVRAQALAGGEPAPRLLGAGEADQMIRELLAGHRDRGGGPWPDFLLPALSSPAFAEELADVLARIAAQGLDLRAIRALARRHHAPEWAAVSAFALEYQQVIDLRQGSSGFGTALDQAELTAAALAALTEDAIAASEQRRIRRLYVDEYQDVDAAQVALIARLAAAADELIVVGDPDQAIYGFRGAEPAALQNVTADATVTLTVSRRLSPTIIDASRRIARLLPGPAAHRGLRAPATDSPPPGSVAVLAFATAAQQATALAAELRCAHLVDGVPWREMAVLVRSPAASAPALRRAFASVGVPLSMGRSEPAGDVVVEALMTVLACAADPARLTAEVALDLLRSPLAGLDALQLRTLRRAVRAVAFGQGTSSDLVAALLGGGHGLDAVPATLLPAVQRVIDVLAAARTAGPASVADEVLWAVWQRSGLQGELLTAAERGGHAGDRANRSLDAVVELFRAAAELTDRLPLIGLGPLVEALSDRRIVDDRDPGYGAGRDAVVLMSAHAAKGLEWDVVLVPDVQEGSWPDLRHRGRLLRADDLLDAVAGVPAPASRVAALLAEERRLFYVAVTRARRRLVCSAVSGQEIVPSRFLTELAGTDEELVVTPTGVRAARSLHLADLVADLRRAVTDAQPNHEAGHHLARLAAAGVPGAHPRDWYGWAPASTERAPIPAGGTIAVSPSAVESLTTCALRAGVERIGGRRSDHTQAQVEGIVVHALADGLAAGLDRESLRSEIDKLVGDDVALAPWQRERTRRLLRHMLDTAANWVAATHPPRVLIGSETDIDVAFPTSPDGHPVRLTGRVDWLSRQADGSVMITDFKSGATVPTRAQAEGNAQLASYQTAVGLQGEQPGGAELVFLRPVAAKTLPQSMRDEPARLEWAQFVSATAEQLARPVLIAQENPRCERCPVRSCCPIQSDGRQVTR